MVRIRVVLLIFGLLAFSGCSMLSSRAPRTYIEYTVRSGDTLYEIGQRFGSSVSELSKINRLRNPHALDVGQKLLIPYRPEIDIGSPSRTSSTPASGGAVVDGSSKRKVELNAARKEIGRLYWPVRGVSINSPFGRRWFSFHEGVDIPAAEGVPFYAAHDGIVVYSGSGLRGYGNLIVLKGENITTVYGHNRVNKVHRGKRVNRGEKIGEVGMTGKATGPHLHFETRIKDAKGKLVAVDPLVFFPNH